jgi:hypothetical protein
MTFVEAWKRCTKRASAKLPPRSTDVIDERLANATAAFCTAYTISIQQREPRALP